MGTTSRIARTVDVDVVRHGSTELVSHRDVARFLDGCDIHDVLILGIEGFRIDGATIEPDMGAILNCSTVSRPDESRAAARMFIDKMPTTELVYEFVFGEDGA